MLDELEEQYNKIHEQLTEQCITEIISIVRHEIESGDVDMFMMAMGSVSFWKENKSIEYDCIELDDILGRFDFLNLPGYGIKIDKDNILTDW